MFRRSHAHHRYRRTAAARPSTCAGAPPLIPTLTKLAVPTPEDEGSLDLGRLLNGRVLHVVCWFEPVQPVSATGNGNDGFGPDDILVLKQASDISGYSVAHLSKLVRDGTIPNAGSLNRPRIFRRDVPMKGKRERDSQGQLPMTGAGPLSDLLREIIGRPNRN